MSLIDRHNGRDSGHQDRNRVSTFIDFLSLDKQDQTRLVHSLFSKPQHTNFDQRDLNHFVNWIKNEYPKPRRLLKTIARDIASRNDTASLTRDPDVGETLTTLYWFGSKRDVRKILRSVLKNGDLEVLMANPDLHQLVHLAKLAKLKSELVRFGSKLINAQDISPLKLNKSFNAFLGEMTYAGVHGLSEALKDPPSKVIYLPNTPEGAESSPSQTLLQDPPRLSTMRNCANHPDSHLRNSFRPLNFGQINNSSGKSLGD